MNFKNIIAYTLEKTDMFPSSYEELNKKLEKYKYVPCDPSEDKRIGWISYFDNYFYMANNCILLSLKKEEKILPNQVVKEEVEKRIEEFKEKNDGKISKLEKQAIKDDVVSSLLPRAFSKYSIYSLIIDLKNSIIYVDSASPTSAEFILSFVRKTFESLPVKPLSFEKDLALEMKEILLNKVDINDKEIEVLEEFELSDGTSTISCKDTYHENEEIQQLLLLNQNLISKLSFNFIDNFSFVLTNEGFVKRIKLDQTFKESLSKSSKQDSEEDKKIHFDADFILLINAYQELFNKLNKMFDK